MNILIYFGHTYSIKCTWTLIHLWKNDTRNKIFWINDDSSLKELTKMLRYLRKVTQAKFLSSDGHVLLQILIILNRKLLKYIGTNWMEPRLDKTLPPTAQGEDPTKTTWNRYKIFQHYWLINNMEDIWYGLEAVTFEYVNM